MGKNGTISCPHCEKILSYLNIQFKASDDWELVNGQWSTYSMCPDQGDMSAMCPSCTKIIQLPGNDPNEFTQEEINDCNGM